MQDTSPQIDYSIPGMRIRAGAPGEPWALVVRTATTQDWVLEPLDLIDRHTTLEHPTTVLYQGQAWRVHEAEQTDSGWVYRLRPCPPGEQQLRTVSLSAADLVHTRLAQAEFTGQMKRIHHYSHYELLLGWLPARLQEHLAERWLFSTVSATRKSGLLQFFIGMGGAFPMMVIAHSLGGWRRDLLLLGWFGLILDGVARWCYAIGEEKPCGWFVLEWPDALCRKLIPPRKKSTHPTS